MGSIPTESFLTITQRTDAILFFKHEAPKSAKPTENPKKVAISEAPKKNFARACGCISDKKNFPGEFFSGEAQNDGK